VIDDRRKNRRAVTTTFYGNAWPSGGQLIATLQQPSCSRPCGCCWPQPPAWRWPASTPNASAAIPSTHHRRPCPRRPTTRRPLATRSRRPQPPPSTDTGVRVFLKTIFSIFRIHLPLLLSLSLSRRYKRPISQHDAYMVLGL